jgi:hypothetical protein
MVKLLLLKMDDTLKDFIYFLLIYLRKGMTDNLNHFWSISFQPRLHRNEQTSELSHVLGHLLKRVGTRSVFQLEHAVVYVLR